MKFKADLKKLYDAGIRCLEYGGTIYPCIYDLINPLSGVILQNGEIVEATGQKYAGGFIIKTENHRQIVLSRKEFRILTKNISEET